MQNIQFSALSAIGLTILVVASSIAVYFIVSPADSGNPNEDIDIDVFDWANSTKANHSYWIDLLIIPGVQGYPIFQSNISILQMYPDIISENYSASSNYFLLNSSEVISSPGYSYRDENWKYTSVLPFSDTEIFLSLIDTLQNMQYDKIINPDSDIDSKGKDVINIFRDELLENSERPELYLHFDFIANDGYSLTLQVYDKGIILFGNQGFYRPADCTKSSCEVPIDNNWINNRLFNRDPFKYVKRYYYISFDNFFDGINIPVIQTLNNSIGLYFK